MEKQDAVAVWMKRAALAGILVLLGLMCLLVWRLSVLVSDVNRNVSALSGDMRQVTQVAADLSDKVEEAAQRMNGIVQSDTVSGAAERAGQAIQDYAMVAPAANESARAEIAHLLACIRDPKLKYEYSGKSRTAAWVALKLNGKYTLYQHSVVSAEDFIQKIAARTSEGDTYYIIQSDGSKTELATYLTNVLAECRASKEPAEQAPAAE